MRENKIRHNLIKVIIREGVIYPAPSNLNNFWAFGSLLICLLLIQILTGILLAIHYIPYSEHAFDSVEHILRDVSFGWVVRYAHASGASLIFMALYIHLGKALYMRSYFKISLWISGVFLFLFVMMTAFLGYVLPWGQMSYWGATVITNLFSTIPVVGNYLVVWLWGGFSVTGITLSKFFVLHFVIPFIILAFIAFHIYLLHLVGSSNPLGVSSKVDLIWFYPKVVIKDVFFNILLLGGFYILVLFYEPNILVHADNYIKSNPLVTPIHICPEWYFLPFYAILRSCPNKIGGAVSMGFSILILLLLPFLSNRKHALRYSKPANFFYWGAFFNFFLLGYLGSQVLDSPYIGISKLATFFYFIYFLVVIPVLNLVENYLDR